VISFMGKPAFQILVWTSSWSCFGSFFHSSRISRSSFGMGSVMKWRGVFSSGTPACRSRQKLRTRVSTCPPAVTVTSEPGSFFLRRPRPTGCTQSRVTTVVAAPERVCVTSRRSGWK